MLKAKIVCSAIVLAVLSVGAYALGLESVQLGLQVSSCATLLWGMLCPMD